VVGDERAESKAPPIHHCLGLLAPVCLKVEMVCEVVVDVQPPGFAQGVEWVGESETVLEVVVNIQPPGFVQGVEGAGESEMVLEVVVNVQCSGLVLSTEGGPRWQ